MKEGAKKQRGLRVKSAAKEIAYLALSVAIITVCAWITIPVGTIPVTLQTFAVALIGALFGVVRGTAALFVYLIMGLVGIPVFSSFNGGVTALLGPTGGYILGFLFDVAIVGIFSNISLQNKVAKTALLYFGMILAMAVCYFFGTLWFITVYSGGGAIGVGAALMLCVVPYLLPDAIKLFIAAVLGVRLKPYLKLTRKKQKNPQ